MAVETGDVTGGLVDVAAVRAGPFEPTEESVYVGVAGSRAGNSGLGQLLVSYSFTGSYDLTSGEMRTANPCRRHQGQ